jgi:hypothetical protein
MNQQAKEELSQLLEETPKDGRPKMRVGMKDMEETSDVTPGSLLIGSRQGNLPGNCLKKRERFPTTIVEYEENEVRDLLALERLKKKKKKKRRKRRKTIARCCA